MKSKGNKIKEQIQQTSKNLKTFLYVELRASCLLGRYSISSYSSSSFCVGYFSVRVLLYAWTDLNHDLPICASPSDWDNMCIPPSLTEMGSWNFLPGLPLNHDLSDKGTVTKYLKSQQKW
jgi:hypothetical protein